MKRICVTCGTQFTETELPPDHCPICEDERQYVGLDGQKWTTLEELRLQFVTVSALQERSLTSFAMEPHFAIGQRAFLIQTPEGNVLWDCISLLDAATIEYIQDRGGLHSICISHPHYYTTMADWSHQFGNVPIHLHRDDAQWVMRTSPALAYWDAETKELPGGLRLIRCGGHFPGGTVLHWPRGAEGKGALLTGDVIQICQDRKHVSFMRSYPNWLPLGVADVKRIAAAVELYSFDRIYGAFPEMTIAQDGKEVMARSVERYLRAIGG